MTKRQFIRWVTFSFAAVLATTFLIALAFAQGPPEGVLSMSHPRAKEVAAIQEAVTPRLMGSMQDVLGTAITQDDDGEVAMVIYINAEGKNPGETVRNLPRIIGPTRVKVEVTDPFRALGKPTKPPVEPPVSHTAIQTPPIQLGTSGGWGYDLANGYCCGGTLGSLVQIGANKYVMSNYHVMEADTVSGGNGIVATTGDPVIQPGLIDVVCNANTAQAIGTLYVKSSLPNHNVDVGIAEVDGMVRADGAILEIGTISASTVSAFVGQLVKKSGRTTGLTRSKVYALNAIVNVAYDDECAGAEAFVREFTGQIVITNRASKFLAGGDSGSLMVQDVAASPKAVGLLFAGSSSYAIANPINDVLDFLDATMVGN